MTAKHRSIDDLYTVMGRSMIGVTRGDPVKIAAAMGWDSGVAMLTRSAERIGEAVLSVHASTGAELTTYIQSLQSSSFAVAAAARANSYDLHAVIGVLDEIAPTASVIAEGQPSVVDVAKDSVVVLVPGKCVYLTAFSTELVASANFGAIAEQRARIAVSRGLDAQLLSLISPGSSGSISGTSDALGDVYELISLINQSGSQPLILGAHPLVSTKMGLLRQGGVLCFPGVSATGQSEVCGLPMSCTDRIPAGEMVCLDPSGMAITIEAVEVATSKNAALELVTSNLVQNAAQGTGTALISMFQSSAIAFMTTVSFGMAVIRGEDVSSNLSDINWANS